MGLVLPPGDRGELRVMGRTRPRPRRLIGLSALVLAVAILSPTVVARPKTDVLVMKNGDRLTCEIQTLERGQLQIKTDYTMGVIIVDWDKVERIETQQRFQVETTDGRILAGALEKKDPQADYISVIEDDQPVQVPQSDVVVVRELDTGLWDRLDGGIDYGFSFTKANSRTQSNLNMSLEYNTAHWTLLNRSNFIFSGQSDGADTRRLELTNIYVQNLKRRNWFALGIANFLRNSEQQLDLRSTLGGGIGRRLIRSNRSELTTVTGLVFSGEKFSPETGQERADNAEVLLGTQYSTFQFDSTSFEMRLLVYPNLTDLGRVRMDFITDIKLDIVGNLYWNASFFDNFDSRPPAGTSRNDISITTSVGWSF